MCCFVQIDSLSIYYYYIVQNFVSTNNMSPKVVSIKAKRPNYRFEQWLTEWRDQETQEAKRKHYDTALEALRKFPLPLATGQECIILQGFGEKLCKRIDDKLKSTLQTPAIIINHQLTKEEEIIKPGAFNNIDTEVGIAKQVKTGRAMCNVKKKQTDYDVPTKNIKTYCPAYRSGGYAILCALYKFYTENNEDNELCVLLKKDLIISAQRFCDKSFTKKNQDSVYTAWSSMSTLIMKQLVKKEGNPAKFQLTEAGIPVAKSLYDDALNDPENALFIHQKDEPIVASVQTQIRMSGPNNIISNKRKLPKNPSSSSIATSCRSDDTTQETYIFAPGLFKVYLLVDTQETSGVTKKDVCDEILMELNRMCVLYEIRHLKIGDYAWVCRHDETSQELVLPYVVERKRMDDFGASIKDGRFHEQKFRLKQSGIQNLIYLVESHGDNLHCGMPLSSIYQAATNTLLQDGFALKFTDNILKTAEYLAMFSKQLSKIFTGKTLMNCAKEDLKKYELADDLIGLMAFKEFNLSSSKNKPLKVSDMFVKQLLQLHGISVDKALAIVSKYPSPRLLKFAYDACSDEKEAEGMLANIKFGTLNKKVGPVISATVYQLYTFKEY